MTDRLRADGHVTPERVEWPEDGSPAAFLDLLACLERAFHAGARWQARSGTKEHGVPWTGPESSGFRTTMPLSWQLGPEGMAYEYGNGRTFLIALLSVALQLGMEQGIRQEREELKDAVRLVAMQSDSAASMIHRLVERIGPEKNEPTRRGQRGELTYNVISQTPLDT